MNKKDLIEIALKILGIYLSVIAFDSFIGIINGTTYFVGPYTEEKTKGVIYLFTGIIKSTIYLGGAWLLITKSNIVIKRLDFENLNGEFSNSFNIREFNRVLFQTVGIMILFFSIEELFSGLFYTRLFGGLAEISSRSEKSYIYFILFLSPAILKTILGCILLFIPRYTIRLLNKKDKATVPNNT